MTKQNNNLITLIHLRSFAVKVLSIFASLSSTTNEAIQELDKKKVNKEDIEGIGNITELTERVTKLELQFTDVTSNHFSVTFDTLDEIQSDLIKCWDKIKQIIIF